MILGLLICLCMLRLGVWQLDRAGQKQVLLDQMVSQSEMQSVGLNTLLSQFAADNSDSLRYRRVETSGRYAPEHSIYVDNQVVLSKVGYTVFTPFNIDGSGWWVLVKRGWIGVGASRTELPAFETDEGSLMLRGRLNLPPPQPPLWNDKFPVAEGPVWQYLPIEEYATQMRLKLLPLVLELAPDQTTEKNPAMVRVWDQVDTKLVGMHQAYALQWFAMAIAFFIACLVLLIRTRGSAQRAKKGS